MEFLTCRVQCNFWRRRHAGRDSRVRVATGTKVVAKQGTGGRSGQVREGSSGGGNRHKYYAR